MVHIIYLKFLAHYTKNIGYINITILFIIKMVQHRVSIILFIIYICFA